MADINVDVNLPNPISVDVTSPTQALATNISIPGPQGPRGEKGNLTSINSLTAENIIITGANGNIVTTSGPATIYISGNSGYFESKINTLTSNYVDKTTNQTIGGEKIFTGNLNVTGSGIIVNVSNMATLQLSGYRVVTVNETGSFAGSVSVSNVVYTTGNQIISGVKTFADGSNQIINTTYSELTGLRATSGLLSGQLYRISDFILKWNNQSINDQTVKTAASGEPLIVTAISNNKISHIAQSEIYPQDTIYYNINASGSYSWGTINNNAAIPDFKGWIYRRVDNLLNIDIPYDWRNITVNCCKLDVSSIPNYYGNYEYNRLDVVKETGNNSNRGKLYYSLVTGNSGNALDDDDYWYPVSAFVESGTYFATDESFGFPNYSLINLPAITGSRIQQSTFTSTLTGLGAFTLNNVKNIKIEDGHSNVIIGNNIIDNRIGGNFYYNTVGNGFRYNTVGNNFNYNTVGNSFFSNIVGNSFDANIVGNDFNYNTVGNSFNSNTVGNSFNSNIVGNSFDANIVGNDFNSNTVGNSFNSNIVGNNFNYNTVGNDFNYNTVGNSFNYNTVGNSFNSNTVGNDFNYNTVGNSFNYNTVGNSFNSNIVGNNFNYNTVGNDFNYNTVGNSFNYNTVGNSFINNTIGNNCNGNQVGNSFGRNTIGNDFFMNFIGNIFYTNTIGNFFYGNYIGNNFRLNTAEDNVSSIVFLTATHVYNNYNTTLFKNSAEDVRLRYFNSNDQLVVTDPTA